MPILRVKINAGAPQAALPAPTAPAGASVVMSLDTIVGLGIDTITWRIVHSPDGYNPGGSWTQVGDVWQVVGPTAGSPAFVLPTTGFDTYLLEAVARDDTGAVILTLQGGVCVQGSSGLRKLAYQEQGQVDTKRKWTRAIRELEDATDDLKGRQSHSGAVIWAKLDDATSPFVSSGTADMTLAATAGTYSTEVPGPLGKCIFLKSDAAISGGQLVGLGTGSCTIWAWFIPSNVGPNFVWGKYNTTINKSLMTLSFDTGNVTAAARIGGADTIVSSDTSVAPLLIGQPNLAVATYDSVGHKLHLWLNGIYCGAVSASGSITWVTEAIIDCKWVMGNGAFDAYTGFLCEVGADNRLYSVAEILEMWRRGRRYP